MLLWACSEAVISGETAPGDILGTEFLRVLYIDPAAAVKPGDTWEGEFNGTGQPMTVTFTYVKQLTEAGKPAVLIEGVEGRVTTLNSRATIITTADGNEVRIPNAIVYKTKIVNLTHTPERRFEFGDDQPAEHRLEYLFRHQHCGHRHRCRRHRDLQ